MQNDISDNAVARVSAALKDEYGIPANASNITVSRSGQNLLITPKANGTPTMSGAEVSAKYSLVDLSTITSRLGQIRVKGKVYQSFSEFSDAVFQNNTIRFEDGDLDLTFPLDLTGTETLTLKAKTDSVRFSGTATAKVFMPPRLKLRFKVEGSFGAGQSIRVGYIRASAATNLEQFELTLDGVAAKVEAVAWSSRYYGINAIIPASYPDGAVFSITSSVPFGTGVLDESTNDLNGIQGLSYSISRIYEITQDGVSDPVFGFINQIGYNQSMVVESTAFSKNKLPIDISALFANVNLTSLPAGLFDGQTIVGANRAFAKAKITSLPAGLFAKAKISGDWSYCFHYTKLTTIPEGTFPSTGAVTSMRSVCESTGSLTSIDPMMFKHSTGTLVDVGAAFYYSAITSVPAGLLTGCVNIYSVKSMFEGSKLNAIPDALFSGLSKLIDASSAFSRTQVVSIPSNLFKGCVALNDLSSCFGSCSSLTTVPTGLFTDCTKVTRMYMTFYDCRAVTSMPLDIFKGKTVLQDASYAMSYYGQLGMADNPITFSKQILADCTALREANRMFISCQFNAIEEGAFDSLTSIVSMAFFFGGASWSTSGAPIASIPETLFRNCRNLSTIAGMFAFSKITSVPEKLFSNMPNPGQVTTLSGLFYSCTLLTSVPANLFSALTNVSNIDNLFGGLRDIYPCGLTSIPDKLFASFASKVTSAVGLFGGSKLASLSGNELAGFTNCTTIESMFAYSMVASIPVNLFNDLTSVTTMNNLFESCIKLTDVPATAFSKMTKLIYINYMFTNCTALVTLRPGWFDSSKLYYGSAYVFMGCTAIVEVPAKLFPKVEVLNSMLGIFNGCKSLKLVRAGWVDLTGYTYSTSFENAFAGVSADIVFEANSLMYRANFNFSNLLSQVNNNGVYSGFSGSIERLEAAFAPLAGGGSPNCYSMLTRLGQNVTNDGLTGKAKGFMTKLGLTSSSLGTVFGPWTNITWE